MAKSVNPGGGSRRCLQAATAARIPQSPIRVGGAVDSCLGSKVKVTAGKRRQLSPTAKMQLHSTGDERLKICQRSWFHNATCWSATALSDVLFEIILRKKKVKTLGPLCKPSSGKTVYCNITVLNISPPFGKTTLTFCDFTLNI